MNKIGIVISSTRPGRICNEIADWVLDSVQGIDTLSFALVDLAVINLPFLDEPAQPAYGNYLHEHTKAWSNIVNSFDGFMFVAPQYNWGYPAPLKNALDFLYAEWNGKPATIITYGTHGGGKAAAQLQVVLQGLHMKNTERNPQLSFAQDMLGVDGRFKDIAADFAPFQSSVHEAALQIKLLLSPSML